MAKHLEEIFNECLERIRQGESIESCLSSYPEYAAELEELLSTVLNVRWRASIAQPRPEFKTRARAQFLGTLKHARQFEQPKSPSIFSLQRAWIPALASVLILLFGTVGTAAASTNAMPDQPLYNVKLTTEQVRLTFTFSDTEKVKYNVQLAENRSQEIVYMAEKGETEQIAVATERLSKHLQEANFVIERIEEQEMKDEAAGLLTTPAPSQPELTARPSQSATEDTKALLTAPEGGDQAPQSEDTPPRTSVMLKELVSESISRNVISLDNALLKVSEATRPALEEAIETSRKLEPAVRDKSQTETKPVTVQPEKIELVRPENQDSQSTTDSKELEIQVRPKTNSSDTDSEKTEELRNSTDNRDTSTNDSTEDTSVSPVDGTGTDNRSSINSLNITNIASTTSTADRLVIIKRK